jgi:hypothetical protein
MLIKNIFVYVSINKIGILIDWSDNDNKKLLLN